MFRHSDVTCARQARLPPRPKVILTRKRFQRDQAWCSEWFTFTGTSRVRFILWSVIYAVSLMNSANAAESKLIDANGCVSLAAYHPRLKHVIKCL